MKRILSISFLAILFSVPLLLVQELFASPESYGLASGEVFLFLLTILLPQGKIAYRLPFFGGILAYMLICGTPESYASSLFYGFILILTIIFSCIKVKFLLSIFFYLLLSIFAAENFSFSTLSMDLGNVWDSASFYWWGILLFIGTPLIVVALNVFFSYRFLLSKPKFLSCRLALTALIGILGLHFVANEMQQRQPILEFSVPKFFWRVCTPGVISHSSLLNKDTKDHFDIWNLEDNIFDFNRPTVFILMESWGVNQKISFTDLIVNGFDGSYENAEFVGISSRFSSFTQGAEWEDFDKDNPSNKTIPQIFKDRGFETWFIHGYDGDFYHRESSYGNMGFDSLMFKEHFLNISLQGCSYGFSGICDSSIVNWLDKILLSGKPKFVYWTTLDAHPPYEGQHVNDENNICKNNSLSNTECVYLTRQSNTIRFIKKLAKNHPEYRFILKGDHRPMGSMEESGFVASFYFKWVPLVILNR
ncbi:MULTISPECIES: sulfatase-like hydrolase/transferase [unclassified Fibrobacter]|uniref:sulfatase-like hydrolase/transferase n=1 Tax=unclassified Fibrobacter TaxID=2634177 RepID=UPI0009152850|nr:MULTISPECIES: sulfatase-like hydrolase/transferase [unclassified Fibrobacter]OWV02504.1 hypothetical protein B7993_15255 [Fibrobacter sp. UWH3]SHK33684.1 Phosphoglycerol transferase MdoB [Fibrobacter sp. UWH6]